MALVIPRLRGPISVLSSVVRVQGHLPHATVEVYGSVGRDVRLVASGVPPTAGDGLLTLLHTLYEGEVLSTRQALGSERSDVSPDGHTLEVLKRPTAVDLGSVAILSAPTPCGEALYIEGAYPGSLVKMWVRVLLGSGLSGRIEAIGCVARLAFSPGLTLSDTFYVRQEATPWDTGSSVPVGDPDPVQFPRPLPSRPRVVGPISVSDGAFLLVGLRPGALVEVEHRRRGVTLARSTKLTDLPSVHWPISPTFDLAAGDELVARQSLCGVWGSPSGSVVVEGLHVPRAWLLVPSEHDTHVVVENATIGREVVFEIERRGQKLTFRGQAYAPTSLFLLPGGVLQAAEITVRCPTREGDGPRSDSVKATSYVRPEVPRIVGPLYSSTTRVRVSNAPRGALVRLVSRKRGPAGALGGAVVGEGVATGPMVWDVVDVAVPSLQEGDTVHAEVLRGGSLVTSPPQTVRERLIFQLAPPEVQQVWTSGPVVVRRVASGAVVELFVNGVTVDSPQVAIGNEVVFARPRSIALGASVRARQRVRNWISVRSEAVAAREGVLAATAAVPLGKITGDANDTLGRYNLPGMDLGVPVEHEGKLYLFFGDSSEHSPLPPMSKARPGVVPPPTKKAPGEPRSSPFIRPIAVVTDEPEDPDRGLGLDFLVDEAGKLALLRLVDIDNTAAERGGTPTPLPKGQSFEVPTGGFSYDGKIHVFVMRKTGSRHVTDEATAKSFRENHFGADTFAFPGIIGGRSVLASTSDPRTEFDAAEVCDIRGSSLAELLRKWKFAQVCPLVADGGTIPELGVTGDVLLLWGTGAPRQSDVCFAWTPLKRGEPIPEVSEWRFLTGMAGDSPVFSQGALTAAVGLLKWSDQGQLSPVTNYPKALPIEYKDDWALLTPSYTVGEFSVIYLPLFRSWLMLYTGDTVVLARIAVSPWGPWLPGGVGVGTVLLRPHGFYAPYAISRYSRWDERSQDQLIYFLGSYFEGGDPHGWVSIYRASLYCAMPRLSPPAASLVAPGNLAPRVPK